MISLGCILNLQRGQDKFLLVHFIKQSKQKMCPHFPTDGLVVFSDEQSRHSLPTYIIFASLAPAMSGKVSNCDL